MMKPANYPQEKRCNGSPSQSRNAINSKPTKTRQLIAHRELLNNPCPLQVGQSCDAPGCTKTVFTVLAVGKSPRCLTFGRQQKLYFGYKKLSAFV